MPSVDGVGTDDADSVRSVGDVVDAVKLDPITIGME